MSYPVDLDIPSAVGSPSVEHDDGTQARTEPGTASHPEKPDFSTRLVTS